MWKSHCRKFMIGYRSGRLPMSGTDSVTSAILFFNRTTTLSIPGKRAEGWKPNKLCCILAARRSEDSAGVRWLPVVSGVQAPVNGCASRAQPYSDILPMFWEKTCRLIEEMILSEICVKWRYCAHIGSTVTTDRRSIISLDEVVEVKANKRRPVLLASRSPQRP
jgi:hypothetical protein